MNATEEDTITRVGANMQAAISLSQNAVDEALPQLAAFKPSSKCLVNVNQVRSYCSKKSVLLSAPLGWQPLKPSDSHLLQLQQWL